jgi:hypothetical protein
VPAEPSPSPPDEPLEDFYGDQADEVLAETSPDSDADGDAASSAGAARSPGAGGGAGGARRHGVTGALMAGIAMGLRDVFEPDLHDRIAIEQPAPEQPLEPQKYEVHLDPVAPESSFAIYRPWVDEADGDEEADDAEGPGSRSGRGRDRRGGGMGALGG